MPPIKINNKTIDYLFLDSREIARAYLNNNIVFDTQSDTIFVSATGGTVTNITQGGINYRVHTFTGNGTLNVEIGGEIEYLIVGGGGGGEGGRGTLSGCGNTGGGGGGGAGGYRFGNLVVTSNTEYPVIRGNGGSGGAFCQGENSTSGGNSSFAGITALGGGKGGNKGGGRGVNGGSGGGGTGISGGGGTGTSGQGRNGGSASNRAGGGGGGASTAGSNGNGSITLGGGAGGNGISSNITGVSVTRAAGGRGGHNNSGQSGSFGGGGGAQIPEMEEEGEVE